MKKTLTVNLNSIVFHIDEDAYVLLDKYLSEIAIYFTNDAEKEDIMSDIESRIAELFGEKLQKNKHVISLEDVNKVIEIMGKPSQYADQETPQDSPTSDGKGKLKNKRYYRDPENAILGGVAGGLSVYFNWDITIVRILLVLIALISSGSFIPIYIVVWFVAPKAVTASQRLEMQGEDVTVDSIKSEINNVKNYVKGEKFKRTSLAAGSGAREVLLIVFKVFAAFVTAILGLAGIVMILTIIFVLVLLLFQPLFFNTIVAKVGLASTMLSQDNLVLLLFSLLLILGCPLFLVIYWTIRFVSGRRPGNYKITSLIVFILWLSGVFMFYSLGINSLFVNRYLELTHNHMLYGDEKLFIKKVLSEPFHSIKLDGNIKLELEQDRKQEVIVSYIPDSSIKIITDVENGNLKVHTEGININRPLYMKILVDSIDKIEASGATMVRSTTPIASTKLLLELNDLSSANLIVNISDSLHLKIGGVSSAKLVGKSKCLTVLSSGASKTEAFDLQVDSAKVFTFGVSKVKVNPIFFLKAEADEASSIICMGIPANVNKKYSGVSKILMNN